MKLLFSFFHKKKKKKDRSNISWRHRMDKISRLEQFKKRNIYNSIHPIMIVKVPRKVFIHGVQIELNDTTWFQPIFRAKQAPWNWKRRVPQQNPPLHHGRHGHQLSRAFYSPKVIQAEELPLNFRWNGCWLCQDQVGLYPAWSQPPFCASGMKFWHPTALLLATLTSPAWSPPKFSWLLPCVLLFRASSSSNAPAKRWEATLEHQQLPFLQHDPANWTYLSKRWPRPVTQGNY